MYAIIDIETTGGSPKTEKITEIAIFIHNGEKVVDEFVTLINPEKDIPYYITSLTGINNEMLTNAPKFYEVAKKIIEITENRIFVAHNVNFDYSFVKSEFKSLGYSFQRECLCTVRLSRKFIPGKRSYSLGNLCDDLGIQICDRHRAARDALAAVKVFEILLDIKKREGSAKFVNDDFSMLHPLFDREKIKNAPEATGVYYFYNDRQEIIYIGKSKNIKSRVVGHFSQSTNKKTLKMKKEIADISFEITGSELIALLLESEEIKKHKPLYNQAQRRTHRTYGINSSYDEDGYLCFFINNNDISECVPLCSFSNQEEARKVLNQLVEKYVLCQKLCGLYKSQGNCFHYQIRQCNGACIKAESAEDYNRRALMALNAINSSESLLIIDRGRNEEEKSVTKIANGKYIGYGFIDLTCISGIDVLHECIRPRKDNHDVWQIIKSYLKNNRVEGSSVASLKFQDLSLLCLRL